MSKGDALDPKGLIAEAYLIDGITEPDCRTIFLDWALSVGGDADTRALVAVLLERHGVEGHPMTKVLRDGLDAPPASRRRGGARGRTRP